MLAIVGEAGIGKTSTVEEFVRGGLPADRVLWGRCSEQLGAPTFWPGTRASRSTGTRDAATLREELAGDAEAIGRLARPRSAGGGRRAGGRRRPAGTLPPLRRRHVVPPAPRAAAPLVVVLEDIHWADDASRCSCSRSSRARSAARRS
jgi:hypothetical protein